MGWCFLATIYSRVQVRVDPAVPAPAEPSQELDIPRPGQARVGGGGSSTNLQLNIHILQDEDKHGLEILTDFKRGQVQELDLEEVADKSVC